MYSGVSFEKQPGREANLIENAIEQCESKHECMRNNPDVKPTYMKRLILTQADGFVRGFKLFTI